MTATLNGRPHQQRKQLSDQLDRLDQMIDCLSEALPLAMADATRQAVREALADLFTNPETLARLRHALGGSAVPPPVETPSPATAAANVPGSTATVQAGLKRCATAVVETVKRGVATLRGKMRAAKARAAAVVDTVKKVVPLGRIAAVAAAVGVTVAVVSYTAPQGFSAVVSGVGGAVVAAAVQTYRWLRNSARSVGLVS
jgi:hypothetical protein